ncbi:MAG TPA: BON domain-containing protein, partial [Firmicutes bacterium]|nr:BON domain-containing protein [Bacillota bacterium]
MEKVQRRGKHRGRRILLAVWCLIAALVLACGSAVGAAGTSGTAAAPMAAAAANHPDRADHADQEILVIPAGESRVLAVKNLERVAVADPAVADVVVASSGEIIVNGKKPGTTSLHLWEKGERRSLLIRVEVDLEEAVRQITGLLDDPAIQVKAVNGALVLAGTVDGPKAAERAEKLARAFSERVINLLQWKEAPAQPAPPPAGAVSSQASEAAADLEGLPARVEAAIGVPTVRAKLAGKVLLLDGTVLDKAAADRALEIASALGSGVAEKVVSVLKIEPAEPPQVLLQVQVVEIAQDALTQLGIAWGTMKPPSEGGFFPSEAWVGQKLVGGVIEQLLPLTGRLDAMYKEGTAKLLAAPSILTRSGKQAEFLAGGEIPVVIQSPNGNTVYWKEYGVKLSMAPEVQPDGQILVHLKPEVSTLDWASGARMNNGL